MKKLLNVFSVALLSLVLFGCGNAFNSAETGSISFLLPQAYNENTPQRAALSDDDYFKVVCVNRDSKKTVYSQDYKPGSEVFINGITVGNYEVSVSLYQKDIWTGFKNSKVKTSSKTAECSVSANQTTDVELKMPSPVFVGVTSSLEAMFCKENIQLCCDIGEMFRLFFTTTEAIDAEKLEVVVNCNGKESTVFPDLYNLSGDNTYKLVFDGDDICYPFLNAYKLNLPFSVKVFLDESHEKFLTLDVTPDYYPVMKQVFETDGTFSEDMMIVCSDSFFGVIFGEDDIFAITKSEPARMYSLVWSEEKKEEYDSFKIGSRSFNNKLCSFEDGDSLYYGFGAEYKNFDELKADAGGLFGKEVSLSFCSSVNSELNFDVSFSEEISSCISKWLNGEKVNFPEYKGDDDDDDDYEEVCVYLYGYDGMNKPYEYREVYFPKMDVYNDRECAIYNFTAYDFSVNGINPPERFVYGGYEIYPEENYCLDEVDNNLYIFDDVTVIPKARMMIPEDGSIAISSGEELKSYIGADGTLSGNFYLIEDITLPTEWTAVKFTSGVFDGCGYSITWEANEQIFSQIGENATVKNLIIKRDSSLIIETSAPTFATFGTVYGYLVGCMYDGLVERLYNGVYSTQDFYVFAKGDNSGRAVGCLLGPNQTGAQEMYIEMGLIVGFTDPEDQNEGTIFYYNNRIAEFNTENEYDDDGKKNPFYCDWHYGLNHDGKITLLPGAPVKE